MEQITHRIHEHTARFSPAQRLLKFVFMNCESKPRPTSARIPVALVSPVAHRLQPLSKRQRVAVVAPWRNAITASGWIPGRVRPLNTRIETHSLTVFGRYDRFGVERSLLECKRHLRKISRLQLAELGLRNLDVSPTLVRKKSGVLAPDSSSAILMGYFKILATFGLDDVPDVPIIDSYKVWLVEPQVPHAVRILDAGGSPSHRSLYRVAA